MTYTTINDIDDSSKYSWLKITDLENMFHVYQDKNLNYKYNLNQTLYLNVGDSAFQYYTLNYDMYWPLISYKKYNTTHLAWLLMKINNVPADKIFLPVKAGRTIKWLNKDTVASIIQSITT